MGVKDREVRRIDLNKTPPRPPCIKTYRKVVRTFCTTFNQPSEQTVYLEELLNDGWEIMMSTPFHNATCIEYILEKKCKEEQI